MPGDRMATLKKILEAARLIESSEPPAPPAPAAEDSDIDAIIRDAPADLIRFQDVAGHVPLPERPTMAEWLDMFNAGLLEAA